MEISTNLLRAGLADGSVDAGLSLRALLEPTGGFGAPIKPAIYEGPTYQADKRWVEGCDEPVDVVVIDNVPSQANRIEAALQRLQPVLGLPWLVLDLEGVGKLPPHVSSQLTSFQYPHRHADSYVRDAVMADGGQAFISTEVGENLLRASAERPLALLEWMPQSLLFGYWQSHYGKKGAQTKFARAVESEIVGYRPAATDTRRLGLKGDPLNLSVDPAVSFDANDHTTWEFTASAKAGKAKSSDSLAEIGHGQVPIQAKDASLAPVSCQSIEQRSTISFARLRNVETGDPARNSAARAALVAVALAGIEAAFSGGFTLRSGCDLTSVQRRYTWRGATGDLGVEGLTLDSAIALAQDALAEAAAVGLPMGPSWPKEPIRLVPAEKLAKVIRATFALDD